MKITGTVAADIRKLEIKSDNTNTGKEALVELDVGLTEQQARDKIGEDFVALAFSTMRVRENDEGEQGFHHLVDSITPGKNCVMEVHRIKFGEREISKQPEVTKIKPVDKEAKVVARIRVPIDTASTELLSELMQQVGQTVDVVFNPAQGELDFQAARRNGNGNGNAHDDDEATGAEAQA